MIINWWFNLERKILGDLGEQRRQEIERNREWRRKYGRPNAGLFFENIGSLIAAVIWLAIIGYVIYSIVT